MQFNLGRQFIRTYPKLVTSHNLKTHLSSYACAEISCQQASQAFLMGIYPTWTYNKLTPFSDVKSSGENMSSAKDADSGDFKLGHNYNKERKDDSKMKGEKFNSEEHRQIIINLTKPPYEAQVTRFQLENEVYPLPHKVKFIPTITSNTIDDYLFVTSMNDVCPQQTEFFQKNLKSHILGFESKVLSKFMIREKDNLKELRLGSLSSLMIHNHMHSRIDLTNPDESLLEAKFQDIEQQFVEGRLGRGIQPEFIDRFRRIIGLEFLSKMNKKVHKQIMNHHLVTKIIEQMKLYKKYMYYDMSQIIHFSGTWQNTLSLLASFNRTSSACLRKRAILDNYSGKKLVQDNDPFCLDVPKMSSQLYFELNEASDLYASGNDSKDNLQDEDYFLRVIYNGKPLGICVDNNEEYKKPIRERIFKIYCPLDQFISLMEEQIILKSYKQLCSTDIPKKAVKTDHLLSEQKREIKMTVYICSAILIIQVLIMLYLCC